MISDGTQTITVTGCYQRRFESDVISDGTQTDNIKDCVITVFESDVISDGTQTLLYGLT